MGIPLAQRRYSFHGIGLTHPGLVRQVNEDAFFADDDWSIYIVCDGMGGHASGHLASQIAVHTMVSNLISPVSGTLPEEIFMQSFNLANQAVLERSLNDPACRGMGTTAVAARADGDRLMIGHVGDSRVYLLRHGKFTPITRDHSLANLYADNPAMAGSLGPAEGHIIVRAIGMLPEMQVDFVSVPLLDSDRFLLCCDGLTDLVTDDEIAAYLRAPLSLANVTQSLIDAANQRGGVDNVTAIVVDIKEIGETAPMIDNEFTRPGY